MKYFLLLFLIILTPLSSNSQIRYREINDSISTMKLIYDFYIVENWEDQGEKIDLDMDGKMDFKFSYSAFDATSQELYLSALDSENEISYQMRKAYKFGEVIGTLSEWRDSEIYSSHYLSALFRESRFSKPGSYIGLKIEKEDGPHYGWIELQIINDSIAEDSYTIIKNTAYSRVAYEWVTISDVITSIDSEKKNHQIQYINNTLLIKFQNQKNRRIKVLDVNGKIYFDEIVSKGHAQIELTKHQMYLVYIEENNSIQRQKIFIR